MQCTQILFGSASISILYISHHSAIRAVPLVTMPPTQRLIVPRASWSCANCECGISIRLEGERKKEERVSRSLCACLIDWFNVNRNYKSGLQ